MLPQLGSAVDTTVQLALPCEKSPFWMGDVKAAALQVRMAFWVFVAVAVVVTVCVDVYTVVGAGDAVTRRQEQALLRREDGARADKSIVGALF